MWDLIIYPSSGPSILTGTLLLPNRCGISQSTLFGAQRLYRDTSPPQPMWDLTIYPSSWPSGFIGTLFLPNRCGISQSTPLRGLTSSLALFPFSNQCGTPTKSTPFGTQRPYWHTTSCLPSFRTQPPRLHITRCLALIPFVIAHAHH